MICLRASAEEDGTALGEEHGAEETVLSSGGLYCLG